MISWRHGNRVYDDDCSVDVFMAPVVVQWNFWLTPIISVFGEAGLADRAHAVGVEGLSVGQRL